MQIYEQNFFYRGCNFMESLSVTQKTRLMKKSLLAFIVVLIGIACNSQQQKTINDQNAEPRAVKGFHSIKAEDGIDLYLTQGEEEAVAVSASRIEYRDKIRTVVQDGVLRIYYDENFRLGWRDRRLRAYV